MEQPLDVLADEVGLKVDSIVHLLETQDCHLGRVWNDSDAESLFAHGIDREADTINGDRTLYNTLAQNLLRRADSEHARIGILLSPTDHPHSTHMTGPQLPAHALI